MRPPSTYVLLFVSLCVICGVSLYLVITYIVIKS